MRPEYDYGARLSSGYRVLKRAGDLLVASIALFALSPFLLLIGLMVVLHDGGSPLHVSWRVGRYGRLIRFYKFRSMATDAEKRRDELLRFNERADGPLFKMRNDPRVTRLGRRIRKYSIDELPQLVSILAGHMSIVGPRPHLPDEVDSYTPRDASRLTVMPGLTCFPQVVERNSMGFREWVDLDLRYCRGASVSMDVYLIGRTLNVVFRPVLRRLQGHRSEVY